MDVLGELLHTLRLRGTAYFHHTFAAPWGMAMATSQVAQFHVVIQGQCLLEFDGSQHQLSQGDVVVILDGQAHRLLADKGVSCVAGTDVLAAYRANTPLFQVNGKPSAQTVLLCGHFELQRNLQPQHPFIQHLPPLIHLENCLGRSSQVQHSIDMLISEMEQADVGTSIIIDRLAEVIFIQVLRAYLQQAQHLQALGFLSALQDAEISKALQLIHTAPETVWHLEGIAHEVGLSRATFASRFHQLVGMPPMQYITQWRMQKAKELLMDTELPIAAIAYQVGYLSEAAFHRVFRRVCGENAGAMRRRLTAKATAPQN